MESLPQGVSMSIPSRAAIQKLLHEIAPDSIDFHIRSLAGSYSNFTHLVEVIFPDQKAEHIVVRRYNPENGHVVEKARREFHALQLLGRYAIPVPEPILLDEAGDTLELPGIVTKFVEGRQIEPPNSAPEWGHKAQETAEMLAKIHSVPFDDSIRPLLMDDNVEVAWFLKSGHVPDWMQADTDGERVWRTIQHLLPARHEVAPVILHTDYWSGNILWQDGHLSAVVDWEEAGYGDPAVDVAYCRMEYYLEGLDDAADEFLHAYEAMNGQTVANLGLWELAASARPMTDPSGWFTRPHMEDRFRRFIANAHHRATS